MTKNWINDIVLGLLEMVGNNNIYDIISYLNIKVIKDNPNRNKLLKKCDAIYIRNLFENEVILIRDNLENEEFILAHEVGHAMLHVDYDFMSKNPLFANGKKEREADYFATTLLYKDLEIEEGIETYEQLANRLGIEINNVKYIIKGE